MQNRTEKQIMSFKTTVNCLFNEIWCYLAIGYFDWKISIFQQTVLMGLLYLKPLAKSILMPLALTASTSATDAAIQEKMFGSGNTTLIISIDEMNGIMKNVVY